MPLETTVKAVSAILRSDPSFTPKTRNELLAVLRNGLPKAETMTQSVERLVRRGEAARRLGYSVRMIDRLAQEGVLRKRKLPGRVRASGFLESDLTALIAG